MKTFNVGLAFVRIWMAFAVVIVHCFAFREQFPAGTAPAWYFSLLLSGGFAVPVFMTMSFFLSGKGFGEGDARWLGRRIVRLLWPFVFWALVTFVLNRLFLGGALAEDHYHCNSTWRTLGIHLVGGTALRNDLQMWFMAVLAALTPCFWLVCRRVPRKALGWTLGALFAASLVAQYTGAAAALVARIGEFGLRMPAGRFITMVPYAAAGLFLAKFRPCFESFSVRRRLAIGLVALGVFCFLRFNDVFVPVTGISYSGLQPMTLGFATFALCYFLPFEKLPKAVVRAITEISKYAMGVYMVHYVLGELCYAYLFPRLGIHGRTILPVLLIFVISWLFCRLVACVPNRWVKALVE